MSKWPRKTIAECASDEPYSTQIGPFGKALTPKEYTSSGVPLLRGVNVNHGRFYDDGFVFISEETADRLSKFESYPDDVLLVHKGTLGQIGLMPKDRKYPRYIMGNSMLRVRCDPTKLIPEYLYYWLSSPDGQHYLFSRVSQVGVPQIQRPLTTLRETSLLVPPLPEQKAIAAILSALDDKIELNRRMNETLEAMARAIFKDWFVDFGPTRAKQEGRAAYLPEPLWSLFPDAIDEETGLPMRWEERTLGEVSTKITKGTTPRKADSLSASRSDELVNFLRVNAISDNGFIIWDKLEKIPESIHLGSLKRSVLEKKDILYTIAGTIGRVAVVDGMLLPANTNQAIAIIRTNLEMIPNLFLYLLLSDKNFQEKLHSKIVHAVQANLSLSVLSGTHAIFPPRETIFRLFAPVESFIFKIQQNNQESRTLAELRDRLLPKLMSGEVRVKEAEKMVEDAV